MDGAGGGGGWQGVGDGRGWHGSRDARGSGDEDQGRGVDGSASSDAFYGHGSGGKVEEAERRPPGALYYGATNNNDYTKYTSGGCEVGGGGDVDTSDYLPHTAAYDTFGGSSESGDHLPGGYYGSESSLDYNNSLQGEHGYGSDSVNPESSDHFQARCHERGEYSDYGSSPNQCYSDRVESNGACSTPGYSDQCNEYSECRRRQHEYTSSTVQVTAKVLFGSVSAISNLKQSKKTTKKK